MWESRPLPKIVRDPLAALSARGSFFMFFPLWCATASYERFLALHVILIVPGTAGDFLFWGLFLPPDAGRNGGDGEGYGAEPV